MNRHPITHLLVSALLFFVFYRLHIVNTKLFYIDNQLSKKYNSNDEA